MNKIICVVGPTASGKTALAVELAKELNGEVISCDSMQIYRGMDIGTAKPTAEEMQNIPHHMIDICDPTEDFSVSRYTEMATPILEDVLSRGKTAIIAGGTGLYVESLIKGNDFAPIPATGHRERLEQQIAEAGIEPLLAQLRAIDPDAADRSQGNPRRIIRALEVYYETGQTITAHNLKTQAIPPRFDATWIGLDFENRIDLYDRIDRRVEIMLDMGLLNEIRGILAAGIPEKATALQAIGYKEFVDALAGRATLQSAIEQVQQSSRRYAKRQLTWFRRNPQMQWIIRRPETSGEEILALALQITGKSDN
ncbi:MAG: tRNA (adenosine(37)-N6)-dimethylallyltransferase MiaA [Ruminococcaceae bacterium]|nr:tRNA (adenosine(37)-N6)-dimethylallyltransferase MiaA [Oscillospiraceae bacterium]